MKMIYCIYLIAFWGNGCNQKAPNTYINKMIFYDHGQQKEITANKADRQSLADLLNELTTGYENNVQLMMTDSRRESILKNGKCLEISFMDAVTVKSNQDSEMKINKILLAFEGELSSPPNQKSCLFLLANERGYIGNVFNSPKGNNVIAQIRSLLKI